MVLKTEEEQSPFQDQEAHLIPTAPDTTEQHALPVPTDTISAPAASASRSIPYATTTPQLEPVSPATPDTPSLAQTA